jgi:hypothetical protein
VSAWSNRVRYLGGPRGAALTFEVPPEKPDVLPDRGGALDQFACAGAGGEGKEVIVEVVPDPGPYHGFPVVVKIRLPELLGNRRPLPQSA